MKPLIFIQSWEIYPFDILWCIGGTHQDVIKYFKRKHIVISEKELELLNEREGDGRCCMLEGGQTVIIIPDGKATSKNIGHIVHEITHAVHFLFLRIGLNLSYDSDEAYCYAMQFMTTKVLGRMLKKK
jgi:hypothetical protein